MKQHNHEQIKIFSKTKPFGSSIAVMVQQAKCCANSHVKFLYCIFNSYSSVKSMQHILKVRLRSTFLVICKLEFNAA